jgi:hypothetical protein
MDSGFIGPISTALSIGELIERILARYFGAQTGEAVGGTDPDREQHKNERSADQAVVAGHADTVDLTGDVLGHVSGSTLPVGALE